MRAARAQARPPRAEKAAPRASYSARAPAFVLLAALLLSQRAEAAVRFLLAVGHNQGLEGDVDLRWAEEDARRVRELMVELGSVSRERALLLAGLSSDALPLELARVRGQVEEARRRGEQVELFVYYSGHGDEDALRMGGERYPLSRLEAELALVPADLVFVLLDACRTSGPRAGRARGATKAPPFELSVVRAPSMAGRVRITSANADEVAQESDDLEGGFFTHHWLTALRGAGDGDQDGRVTLAEAYRYAQGRTLAQSFGAAPAVQHPQLDVDLEGDGEVVLTELGRADAALVLEDELSGTFLVVEDASARVVLEASKAQGAPLRLAVPARRLRVQRRADGKTFAGTVTLSLGGDARLGEGDFVEERATLAAVRGPRIEDPSPWFAAAAFHLASPLVLEAVPAFGASLALERRLFELPVFLRGRASGAWSAREDSSRRLDELDARLSLGAALEGYLFDVRLYGALGAGIGALFQQSVRAEAGRLAALGFETTRTGWALGPLGSVEGGVMLPLFGPLRASGSVGADVALLAVDGAPDVRASGFALVGLALEL